MGIVPRKLKIAKVIPLYKSENPELFTNYRPISIHPCLSKILEHLMYNRINKFLAEYNILSNKQYGFWENYSTYMAMIDLVDKISSNIDQKNHNHISQGKGDLQRPNMKYSSMVPSLVRETFKDQT